MEPEENEENISSKYTYEDILIDVLNTKSMVGLLNLDLSGSIRGSGVVCEQKEPISTTSSSTPFNKENSKRNEKVPIPCAGSRTDHLKSACTDHSSTFRSLLTAGHNPIFQRSSSSDSHLESARSTIKKNTLTSDKWSELNSKKSERATADSAIEHKLAKPLISRVAPIDSMISSSSYKSKHCQPSNLQVTAHSKDKSTHADLKSISRIHHSVEGHTSLSDRMAPIKESDISLGEKQRQNVLDLLNLHSSVKHDTHKSKEYSSSLGTAPKVDSTSKEHIYPSRPMDMKKLTGESLLSKSNPTNKRSTLWDHSEDSAKYLSDNLATGMPKDAPSVSSMPERLARPTAPLKRSYHEVPDKACVTKGGASPPKKFSLGLPSIKESGINVQEPPFKPQFVVPSSVAEHSTSKPFYYSQRKSLWSQSPFGKLNFGERSSREKSPESSFDKVLSQVDSRMSNVHITEKSSTHPIVPHSAEPPIPSDVQPSSTHPYATSFTPSTEPLIPTLPANVQPSITTASSSQCLVPTSMPNVLPTPVAATAPAASKTPSTAPSAECQSAINKTAPTTNFNSIAVDTSKLIFVNGRKFIKQREIGKGGSSVVLSVLDQDFQNKALKLVALENLDDAILQSHLDEIKLLQKFQKSSRVVKLYEFEHTADELKIVMEIGSLDLAAIVRNARKASDNLTAFTIKHYWHEMLLSVQDIHKEGVIHSDLKPANFLLVGETLRLIDFGIASSIQKDMTSVVKENQAGTLNYMSPESLDICSQDNQMRIKIGVKSDIWSLGCILYVLAYGKTPFQHITNVYQKIKVIASPKTRIEFPATLKDDNLLDVLKKCLRFNPKQRPSIQELLDHPYIKSG